MSTDHPAAAADAGAGPEAAAAASTLGQPGPYETARRYAAGQLTREQVIDQLARWPYRPGKPTDGYDWATGELGEFEQTVGRAHSEGLLQDGTYDAILDRQSELAAPAGFTSDHPYAIARQYAAGTITRDQVIDQLGRWPYRPGDPGNGQDWTTYALDEFEETVGLARTNGLIDAATYDAIADRRNQS